MMEENTNLAEIIELREMLVKTMQERNDAMKNYRDELAEHIITLRKLKTMKIFITLLHQHVDDELINSLLEQSRNMEADLHAKD